LNDQGSEFDGRALHFGKRGPGRVPVDAPCEREFQKTAESLLIGVHALELLHSLKRFEAHNFGAQDRASDDLVPVETALLTQPVQAFDVFLRHADRDSTPELFRSPQGDEHKHGIALVEQESLFIACE